MEQPGFDPQCDLMAYHSPLVSVQIESIGLSREPYQRCITNYNIKNLGYFKLCLVPFNNIRCLCIYSLSLDRQSILDQDYCDYLGMRISTKG
jgi:hypothetical protein